MGDSETIVDDLNETETIASEPNSMDETQKDNETASIPSSDRKCETCGKPIPKRRGRPSRFCDEHRGQSSPKTKRIQKQGPIDSVQVTPELSRMLIGALSFSASALDSPVWKLNEEETNKLGDVWYPVLKKYEDSIAEWLGIAVCLIPTAAILGPRVVLRTKIAKKEITTEQAMVILDPALKAMNDVLKGKRVDIEVPQTQTRTQTQIQTGGDKDAAPAQA